MFALAAALIVATVTGTEAGYEERLIAWALAQQQRELEPDPAGKPIEEVLVSAEDIFSASDPWPGILNIFHWRTRDFVIRREVLLHAGDTWDPETVAETERNMRRLFIFAVARVVPVKGRAGGVALLVVTKDRWSLRLNSDFLLVGDLLQFLRIRPTEENLFGRAQQWTLDFLLKLDTLQMAEIFEERRFFGTPFRFAQSAGIVLNRQTNRPEGTLGTVAIDRPLYSLEDRWGVFVSGSWNIRTRRTFCGAKLCQLVDDSTGTSVARVYDVRELGAEARVTRSFGRQWKVDVSAAVGGYSRRYQPPNDATLGPAQLVLLGSRLLPRSEDATYLLGYVRSYRADFRVLKNLEILELPEDLQFGPLLQAGARWAIPTFAVSSFVEVAAAARYRWLVHDDVLTLSLAGALRVLPGGKTVNRHLAGEVINYSPPFEGGRFVARVLFDLIEEDLGNRVILLGGGNGLRGAPAEILDGRNLLLANFEYRTRAFEIQTIYVGFVLFYDAGSAFDLRPNLTHTVGVGIRIMLPQFNQETVRIDFGMVLGDDGRLGLDRFSSTFGQITALRPAFLDDPL